MFNNENNKFKENNSLIIEEITALATIKIPLTPETPIIEFYTIKEDTSITDFVIFEYPKGNMLDFNAEVDACLLYWSGRKWCNTNEETKALFEKERNYFKYNWFELN